MPHYDLMGGLLISVEVKPEQESPSYEAGLAFPATIFLITRYLESIVLATKKSKSKKLKGKKIS